MKFHDGGRRHLDFLKSVAISFFWTDPHQIWWECCESDIERNRFIKSAYLPKFKMADAAILNFENIDLLSLKQIHLMPKLWKFDDTL